MARYTEQEMTTAINHKHTELRKIIAKRLKEGNPFVLGCAPTNVEYWRNILSLHFSHAKVELHEEGLRIS
jgi:hypothetical protein